jgi:hypothetical protein
MSGGIESGKHLGAWVVFVVVWLDLCEMREISLPHRSEGDLAGTNPETK